MKNNTIISKIKGIFADKPYEPVDNVVNEASFDIPLS